MLHRGEYKVPGGKLVVAEFTVVEGRLRNVRITGDFFLFPEEGIHLLAQAIEGAMWDSSVEELAVRIKRSLDADVEMLGFGPSDVAEAIRRGLL